MTGHRKELIRKVAVLLPAGEIRWRVSMRPYDHLVQIDEDTRELKIWRVDADGARTFYTSTELPNSSGWRDVRLDAFTKLLGENLLMDSPAARKLLKL